MHFKKILVGLLAATTLFGLVGCGVKEVAAPAAQEEAVAEETEEVAPEEPELTVEELEAMIKEEGEKDSPDMDILLPLLLEASDKGSAYATYCLCYEYNSGKRLEKDDAKASEYYNLLKTLSDTDDAEALYYYGLCNMYGRGTDVDVQVALEYLEKGANAGNIDCYASLGNLYTGKFEGIERDEAKMFENYKAYCESATENINYSYYNGLGNCYLSGTGVEKDVDTALEWFEKAADGDEIHSILILAPLYYKGYASFDDIDDLEAEKDYNKALNYYEKAADLGHIDSSWILANTYLTGKNILTSEEICDIDYDKALKYYENVIESDEDITDYTNQNLYVYAAKAAFKIGDYVKAREYSQVSIDLGEPGADTAQSNLDYLDEHGL